jgi:hypothetical protein
MKMEQIEYSETSAYKIQTPGNYPEENIQHTEHGESFKSRICLLIDIICYSYVQFRRMNPYEDWQQLELHLIIELVPSFYKNQLSI